MQVHTHTYIYTCIWEIACQARVFLFGAGRSCHGTLATCLQSLGRHESGTMSRSESRFCLSAAVIVLEVKRGHIMGLILGDGSRMLSIVQLHACICTESTGETTELARGVF